MSAVPLKLQPQKKGCLSRTLTSSMPFTGQLRKDSTHGKPLSFFQLGSYSIGRSVSGSHHWLREPETVPHSLGRRESDALSVIAFEGILYSTIQCRFCQGFSLNLLVLLKSIGGVMLKMLKCFLFYFYVRQDNNRFKKS